MNYKKVIAYSNTCVLFELENGFFALVAVDDNEAEKMITISKFAESHMQLAVFTSGDDIPPRTLSTAVEALNKGEHVYICSKLPDELERFNK